MNTQIVNNAMFSYISTNPWVIILLVWSLVWKLIALWKAAKKGDLVIFIILGVLNTGGIAEIAYLVYLYIRGRKNKEVIK